MNVGIFSGSFNPIHMGHLMLANYIIEYSQLDEVWFLVTPQNPWKESIELLDEEKRYEMVKLAIADFDRLKVSDFEFRLPRPSYSANTLNELSKAFPDNNFSLIIGADNWQYFDQWKNYQEILDKYPVYVYPRLGFDIENIELHDKVTVLDTPIIDISSTRIREAIQANKNLKTFLPQGVYTYILENKIYQK